MPARGRSAVATLEGGSFLSGGTLQREDSVGQGGKINKDSLLCASAGVQHQRHTMSAVFTASSPTYPRMHEHRNRDAWLPPPRLSPCTLKQVYPHGLPLGWLPFCWLD